MGWAQGGGCGCCCTPTVVLDTFGFESIVADGAISDGCKAIRLLTGSTGTGWSAAVASIPRRYCFYTGVVDGKKIFRRTGRGDGLEITIQWDIAGSFTSGIAFTLGVNEFSASRSSGSSPWSASTNCGCGQINIDVSTPFRAMLAADGAAAQFTISHTGLTTPCSVQPTSLVAPFSSAFFPDDGIYTPGSNATYASSSSSFRAQLSSNSARFGCFFLPGTCGGAGCDDFSIVTSSMLADLISSSLNRHCFTDPVNYTTSSVVASMLCAGCSSSSPTMTIVES